MVTAPASTGMTAISKNAVISQVQTNRGSFIQSMPGARMLKMVTMTLTAPMMEETPIMCTERMKKSVDGGPNLVDNGA